MTFDDFDEIAFDVYIEGDDSDPVQQTDLR
jgi:hypothetical protein